MIVTRFAPSPTGLLHLGHVHSALAGWRAARAAGGRFLLRIEDIDPLRCQPAFEAALIADLRWLGINWDGPVRRQSEHVHAHAEALARLADDGVVVVKVPNYDCLGRRVRGRRWCGYRWPDHVNYFTPATLATTAARAGLAVARMRFFDRSPLSDSLYAVFQRDRSAARSADDAGPRLARTA